MPMVKSNSSSDVPPSRSQLWLARILNPALDADSMDMYTHPKPAPTIAPSGHSLCDTQLLPSIVAAFPPVPRLESRRALDGNSVLPAVRVPYALRMPSRTNATVTDLT
ncbi:hypothetical protein DFH09DRAFT_1325098 [Mycena vulgaris]|nr:hypothetical protein DFH09DRAFT_1325098 [Mycena vulgaris]